jgi:hypothetical protein
MMSTTLREFLVQQKEQYEEIAKANQPLIEEWNQALHRLYATIQKWLDQADPHHILQVKLGTRTITEPTLGQYESPDLTIRAFGKWVGVIPKARKTIGTAIPPQLHAPSHATGRVDITDELRRYCLYRFQDGEDKWFMVDPTNDHQQPLTQASFEAALLSYFR